MAPCRVVMLVKLLKSGTLGRMMKESSFNMKESTDSRQCLILTAGGLHREQVFFRAAGRRLAGEVIRPLRYNEGDGKEDEHPRLPRGTGEIGEACMGRRKGVDQEEMEAEEKTEPNDHVLASGWAGGSNQGRPWLVFLHEGLGSVGQWRDFPAAICGETGLPGLVYDRWGYGNSEACEEKGNGGYLHQEARESLPQVLKHFGVDRAIFIGHSDGGSIALIFGAMSPERTAGIITEAAHVFVEEVTLAGIRTAVTAYEETDLPARLARYHGDRTDQVFRRWSETWLAPAFREWNIEELLPRISCPVLAIQGEEDPYGTPDQVQSIVRRVSGSVEGFLIPRCGHIPHHQARDEVAAAMKRFVNNIIFIH